LEKEARNIWRKYLVNPTPPIKDDLESILHGKRNLVQEIWNEISDQKRIKGSIKKTDAKETTA